MNKDSIKRLQELRDLVDRHKEEQVRKEGQLEEALRSLKEDFGCKDVKEAEVKLKKLEKEIEDLDEELEEGLNKLEEEYEF